MFYQMLKMEGERKPTSAELINQLNNGRPVEKLFLTLSESPGVYNENITRSPLRPQYRSLTFMSCEIAGDCPADLFQRWMIAAPHLKILELKTDDRLQAMNIVEFMVPWSLLGRDWGTQLRKVKLDMDFPDDWLQRVLAMFDEYHPFIELEVTPRCFSRMSDEQKGQYGAVRERHAGISQALSQGDWRAASKKFLGGRRPGFRQPPSLFMFAAVAADKRLDQLPSGGEDSAKHKAGDMVRRQREFEKYAGVEYASPVGPASLHAT